MRHRARTSHRSSPGLSWSIVEKYTGQTRTKSQKRRTPYSCPYFYHLLTNLKICFSGTLSRKFAINLSLEVQPHFRACHYTTLWNIFFKICTVQQWQMMHTCTEENMAVIDNLMPNQAYQLQVYCFGH